MRAFSYLSLWKTPIDLWKIWGLVGENGQGHGEKESHPRSPVENTLKYSHFFHRLKKGMAPYIARIVFSFPQFPQPLLLLLFKSNKR